MTTPPPTAAGGVKWRELSWTERSQEVWRLTKEFVNDIISYPATVWLIFIVCVFYYVTVFPFIGLAM